MKLSLSHSGSATPIDLHVLRTQVHNGGCGGSCSGGSSRDRPPRCLSIAHHVQMPRGLQSPHKHGKVFQAVDSGGAGDKDSLANPTLCNAQLPAANPEVRTSVMDLRCSSGMSSGQMVPNSEGSARACTRARTRARTHARTNLQPHPNPNTHTKTRFL